MINKGRIIGVLLLATFIIGVTIFQFLQGPTLFGDDFLTATAENNSSIITSTVLGMLNGLIVIGIAAILLPAFKQYNLGLTFFYLSMTIINFLMIAIDNVSVLSLLELSSQYSAQGSVNKETIGVIGELLYKNHWWTHYMSLLTSSFYMFTFYLLFFQSKLVPRVLSVAGLIATPLLFIEILASIYGQSIGMYLMMPIAIVQLAFVAWLLIKGIKTK